MLSGASLTFGAGRSGVVLRNFVIVSLTPPWVGNLSSHLLPLVTAGILNSKEVWIGVNEGHGQCCGIPR